MALSGEDLAAFFLGTTVPVQSSRASGARYVEDDQTLYSTMTDGAIIAYPGVGPDKAESFARAPSRGYTNYERLASAPSKGRRRRRA